CDEIGRCGEGPVQPLGVRGDLGPPRYPPLARSPRPAEATLDSVRASNFLRPTTQATTNALSPQMINLSDDLPAFLKHSDDDTPIPTWEQVTRSADTRGMFGQVAIIMAGTQDEQAAGEVWNSWPAMWRRSVALLIDKICHEGWLESVGPISGSPFDGGFFFRPLSSRAGAFQEVLD